ncbi:hypothetical protein C427_3299 [Paraglaciecola psychrophila 170]|uniref:Uncharacterized protein n=1 Tax=Paraglaciecola psychrophila 170 TaxID=1129794 RepID=K7ABK1_9ALTE|nr:hypothetical protein C427_3299 [Paraglaciecola psychrophila 170]GAC38078.1 hypothetical protein GPSY_2462 [Paraglaciecola psychrophila 170]
MIHFFIVTSKKFYYSHSVNKQKTNQFYFLLRKTHHRVYRDESQLTEIKQH